MDAVPVYPVRGTVTFDGQPMQGAIVTFHGADSRPTAQGIADDSGRFSLTTYLADDGAAAGDYAVTIYWPMQGRRLVTIPIHPWPPID